MAFQVFPECLGSVEETDPRVTKDVWELPVKLDLRVLKDPKEAKGLWDHLERWALRELRATREKRAPPVWSPRGTGNNVLGNHWKMARITD